MTKICPECQTINSDSDEFCKNCGLNLNSKKNVEEKPNWINRLFYWKTPTGYRIAKSKIAFWLVFIIDVISYENFYFNEFSQIHGFSIIIVIFGGIFAGLMFAVPVFVLGFIIHKILEK